MFNWLNKFQRCNHKWEKTLEDKETTTQYAGGQIDVIEYDVVYIYCPLCRTRKKVSPKMWSVIEREQELQANYDLNLSKA
jgi:hypothetical protein